MDTESPSPAVVLAIRERQEKLRSLLAIQDKAFEDAEREAATKKAIAQQTRDDLHELAAFLGGCIAKEHEPDAQQPPNALEHAQISSPANFGKKRLIADHVAKFLSDGNFHQTAKILDYLTQNGIAVTAEKKLARISQIMSLDARFESTRGYGWRLVDRSSAGDSAS